ncbi:VTC domain-containing protein, partial [bacterium]|nr:VTC domain-containing protein [bacterium]
MNKLTRCEIKFPVTHEQLHQFRLWHKHAGLDFKTAYPSRQVHSLYFDTPELANFNDNLGGISHRFKCRLRWYHSELPVDYLQFEVKRKAGVLSSKLTHVFKTRAFPLQPMHSMTQRLRALLPFTFKPWLDTSYLPEVLNQYHREYYVFRQKPIRLTVDTKLHHARLLGKTIWPRSLQTSAWTGVVEVKFPAECRSVAQVLLNSMPLRPDKNSKYIN